MDQQRGRVNWCSVLLTFLPLSTILLLWVVCDGSYEIIEIEFMILVCARWILIYMLKNAARDWFVWKRNYGSHYSYALVWHLFLVVADAIIYIFCCSVYHLKLLISLFNSYMDGPRWFCSASSILLFFPYVFNFFTVGVGWRFL